MIGSRQNTMRVHPSLPSTFLHGFALDVRYQLYWCALQHAVLPVLSQNCHVFCSQLLRRGQAAQERYPHVHERGTELLVQCILHKIQNRLSTMSPRSTTRPLYFGVLPPIQSFSSDICPLMMQNELLCPTSLLHQSPLSCF